jgi:hypothetical protein
MSDTGEEEDDEVEESPGVEDWIADESRVEEVDDGSASQEWPGNGWGDPAVEDAVGFDYRTSVADFRQVESAVMLLCARELWHAFVR